jgi:oligopeptide/dipeptide ABC transporter ATP-binding protein
MIFVTHDLSIVARMCDRVAVMYAGRIVEMGPVRRIFRSPAHPYTRALLDSIPRLGARLERLTVIEGQPPDLARLPAGCAFAPRCPPGHGAVPCGGPARDGDGRGTGDALLAARTGRTRVTERQDGRLRGPLPPRFPSVGRDTASRACRARGRRAAPPPESRRAASLLQLKGPSRSAVPCPDAILRLVRSPRSTPADTPPRLTERPTNGSVGLRSDAPTLERPTVTRHSLPEAMSESSECSGPSEYSGPVRTYGFSVNPMRSEKETIVHTPKASGSTGRTTRYLPSHDSTPSASSHLLTSS